MTLNELKNNYNTLKLQYKQALMSMHRNKIALNKLNATICANHNYIYNFARLDGMNTAEYTTVISMLQANYDRLMKEWESIRQYAAYWRKRSSILKAELRHAWYELCEARYHEEAQSFYKRTGEPELEVAPANKPAEARPGVLTVNKQGAVELMRKLVDFYKHAADDATMEVVL